MNNQRFSPSAPSQQPLSVSVVICAYTEKRWGDLLQALELLKWQTVHPDELIVVIDHNESLYERASQQIDGIILLANRNEKGLSGARNTGIAKASGDIIAFMDEDAVADETWIERIVAHFADLAVAGVGGAIIPLWLQGKPSWFPDEFNWVVGCTYKGMPTQPTPVRNLIGCNMAYRRWAFEQAGVFREGIGRVDAVPIGCEETELCIRIHQVTPQSRLIYDPAIIVHHRVPATRSNWGYFRSRCFAEGFSKALISQFVGANDGLSSERSYATKTLPLGALRGLGDLRHGDLSGVSRAFCIAAGLFITAAGYANGVLRFSRNPLKLDKPPQLKGDPPAVVTS